MNECIQKEPLNDDGSYLWWVSLGGNLKSWCSSGAVLFLRAVAVYKSKKFLSFLVVKRDIGFI